MDRKYAWDYTVEKVLLSNGRSGFRRVYRGAYFRFQRDGAVIRRLRFWLLGTTAAVILLLLPLFCLNTELGRTLYVLLPAALAVLPLYGLLSAARYLALSQVVFTREHRDKTDGRIRSSALWLTILLGISCIGCWISGFGPEEKIAAAGLHLALLASVCLLPQRTKATTVVVDT